MGLLVVFNDKTWTHTEIQDVPFQAFHCMGEQTLEQAVFESCRVSILRGSQNQTGHILGESSVIDCTSSKGFELIEIQRYLPTSTTL